MQRRQPIISPGEGYGLKSSPGSFADFQRADLRVSPFLLVSTSLYSKNPIRPYFLFNKNEKRFHMFKRIAQSVVVAAVLCTPAVAQDIKIEAGMLSVTGQSSVSVENTAAQVNFGVQIQAPSSAEAVTKNSMLLSKVFQAVADHGISPADMQTSGITLHQVTDKNGQHIVGYRMSNRVSIHISDISKLGEILGAATEAGINRIDSVQMVPAKDAVDEDELRRMAAKDARAKAQLYANALGVTITGIQSISEQNVSRPQPYADTRMMRAEAMSVPVAGGSSNANASIHVVYKVELDD